MNRLPILKFIVRTVHVVTFNANGGVFSGGSNEMRVASINGGQFTFPSATHEGNFYRAEWNTKADGSGERFTTSSVSALKGNIAVYAIWEEVKPANVIFHDWDGSWTYEDVFTGNQIYLERFSDKPDYMFEGWLVNNEGEPLKNINYLIRGDVEFHAKWKLRETVEINSVAGLKAIADDDEGFYKLTANIDMTGVNWEPLDFYGKFDGNGFKITNLTINNNSSYYVGLFGYLYEAEITNLALENVNISGADYVGAIAGYLSYSTISNSYSTGNVTGEWSVGGIAGEIYSGTITDTYSIANITGGGLYVGGIAGGIHYTEITNSYSTGNITGQNSVGGISGYMLDSTINFCVAINGSIIATAGNNWGRIAGFRQGNNAGGNNFALDSLPEDRSLSMWAGAKSEAELKLQSTYEGLGWTFGEGGWKMGSSYPILYWQ
jgi:hypothetical protein